MIAEKRKLFFSFFSSHDYCDPAHSEGVFVTRVPTPYLVKALLLQHESQVSNNSECSASWHSVSVSVTKQALLAGASDSEQLQLQELYRSKFNDTGGITHMNSS